MSQNRRKPPRRTIGAPAAADLRAIFPPDLPEEIWADIVGRLEPGSVAGFSLALCLGQIKLLGRFDPGWCGAVFRLASTSKVFLRRLGQLRQLDLSRWAVTDAHLMRILPHLTGLEELRMASCHRLSCEGLDESLSSLTKLTFLDLSSSRLRATSGSLDFLGPLVRLRELDISYTDVGGTGPVDALLRGIDTSKRMELTHLGVLSEVVTPWDQWERLMGAFPSLKSLEIGPVCTRGRREDQAELAQLTHLRIQCLEQITLNGLQVSDWTFPWDCLPSLKSLQVRLPELLLDHFSTMPALTSLSIDIFADSQARDKCTVLEGCTALRTIHLDAGRLSRDAFQALAPLHGMLECLREDMPGLGANSLGDCSKLTSLHIYPLSADIKWLQPLCSLSSASIFGFGLDGSEFRTFRSWPQHLTSLELSNCSQLMPESLNYLPSTLRSLDLSGCVAIFDGDIGAARGFLSRLTGLEDLRISMDRSTLPVVELDFLNTHRKIRSLSLHSCTLGPWPWQTREEPPPCLTSLTISHSFRVNDTTCTDIARTLPRLQHLSLRASVVGPEGVRGLTALACLRILDLSECPNVTYKGLRRLRAMPLLQQVWAFGTSPGVYSDALDDSMTGMVHVHAPARTAKRRGGHLEGPADDEPNSD